MEWVEDKGIAWNWALNTLERSQKDTCRNGRLADLENCSRGNEDPADNLAVLAQYN